MKKACLKINYKILAASLTIIIISILPFFSSCQDISAGLNEIRGKFSQDDDIDEIKNILEDFFNLLIEKDYDKAYELISDDDRQKGSIESFKKEFLNVTDIIDYEINWIEIKNNVAIAGVDLVDSYDGTENNLKDLEVSFVREEEEGSWKIVFWK